MLGTDKDLKARVDVAGCLVAQTCGSLSLDEMRFCFSSLFETAPDCRLFDGFRTAYETERDALDGQRAIDSET